MTEREAIVAFIRREAARYGHAPQTSEAIERVAQLVERREDQARS